VILEFMTLENNFIDLNNENQLSSPFQGLKELTRLDLANNSITNIFEDFTLESLKLLNLSYNKIERFKTDELNNINAAEIDLTHNLIQEVEFDLEVNNDIKILLNYNPIQCNCKVHKFVKHLKAGNGNPSNPSVSIDELRCASPENLVNTAVIDVDPFDLLCPLDNEDTSIKKCPKGCDCSIRYEDKHVLLECDSTVDFALMPLPSPMMNYVASELTITHNNLTELPILMESRNKSGYGIVTNLTLNDNALSTISLENLPPALNVLNVRNNQLETFNETVRIFLSNITSLKLSLGGNPWRCDCTNKGFVSFVQQQIRDNKIADPNDITCDNGETLVNEVDVSKLCSESENLLIMILCIITAIMGLGIGGFAALYYKYQKQIKMWLYSHNLLLWFVTEEELDKVCCFSIQKIVAIHQET
jgi:protein toll